ncbi:MAG: lectin-like protein [Microcoleaceae cyanobacterium]
MIKKLPFATIGAILISLGISKTASAASFFPDTGHYYEYVSVPEKLTWQEAKIAAENKYFNGFQGYLVTITSAAETDFVNSIATNNLDRVSEGWIGASDANEEGVWKWVTGPETGMQFWQGSAAPQGGAVVNNSYANWSIFEPNNIPNTDDGEDFAQISFSGFWNDLASNNDWQVSGYYIEYGGLATVPVSEPTSVLSLFVFSALGLYRSWQCKLKKKE